MNRHPWILLAITGALASGCVSRSAYQEKVDELQQAKAQLRQVSDIAQQYGSQVDGLETERSKLQQQNSMLRSSNDDYNRRLSEMMAELEKRPTGEAPRGDGPVQIVPTGNGYAYRIDGGFLFSPGKSELKASAKKQIAEIAEQLLQNGHRIEVAGHTDTDPVKVTKAQYPLGNIQLGTSRALSVWEELSTAGVPRDRMFVSSYGEYEPVADPAKKAENRRVELRVIVEEPEQLQ